MALSTNAPFNQLGFSLVQRDIEEQELKIQELNNYQATVTGGTMAPNYVPVGNNNPTGAAYLPSGDLSPGSGTAVTSQNPNDRWGRANAAATSGTGTSITGLQYTGLFSSPDQVSVTIATGNNTISLTPTFSNKITDTLGGWTTATGTFIAAVGGYYSFSYDLSFDIAAIAGTISARTSFNMAGDYGGATTTLLVTQFGAFGNFQLSASRTVYLIAGNSVLPHVEIYGNVTSAGQTGSLQPGRFTAVYLGGS